jgi:hypothetical protein
MNASRYCMISGLLFALVAVGHLLRVVNDWPILVGDMAIPMWLSWFGTVVPAFLAAWAFRIAGSRSGG